VLIPSLTLACVGMRAGVVSFESLCGDRLCVCGVCFNHIGDAMGIGMLPRWRCLV